HPALHRARLRPRVRGRPGRRVRWRRARRGPGGGGLRQVREGGGCVMEGLLPDLEVVRKDFPILARPMADGRPLVYLDSANTSQKPQVVIDTMVDTLERHNENIARAMHQLGAESTAAYEGARDKVAAFLGAPDRDEV